VLNGSVSANGASSFGWFQWGLTTSYGNTTPAQAVPGNLLAVPYSNAVINLSENTTYHFRAVCSNSAGLALGTDKTFKTTTMTVATTVEPTIFANGTATLNGTINPGGRNTTAYFVWGPGTSYGNATTSTLIGSGTNALSFSSPISGLTGTTVYHYRVVASN